MKYTHRAFNRSRSLNNYDRLRHEQLRCDSLGSSQHGINVRSDVFAVGASLSIMAGGAKVIVPSDSFAIIDKAYGFPVLGKKLFAAL